MLSDEEIMGLSGDPYEGFVQLERIARKRRDEQLARDAEENISQNFHPEREYISDVLAGAAHYKIEALNNWRLPSSEDNVYDVHEAFDLLVRNLTTRMRLDYARQRRENGVRFDFATKRTLRALLDQMRQAVDEEPGFTPRKKHALFGRIADLAREVDTDWTRSESLGNLMVELASAADESAGKMERLRKLTTSILEAFGKARSKQHQPELPAPVERKRIGSPKDTVTLADIMGGNADDGAR